MSPVVRKIILAARIKPKDYRGNCKHYRQKINCCARKILVGTVQLLLLIMS